MYKFIKVLPENTCKELVSKLQTSTMWHDGAFSTGSVLKNIKQNKELDICDLFKEIADIVIPQIMENADIQNSFLLKKFITMLISKTNIGGGYGGHFDAPYFPSIDTNQLTRCDYSFSIFLNDNYTGGNLKIEGKLIKPKTGYICIYPSNCFHEVTRVKTNERYAVVGWLESLIKDHKIREAIVLLNEAKFELSKEKNYLTTHYKKLEKATQLIWTKSL